MRPARGDVAQLKKELIGILEEDFPKERADEIYTDMLFNIGKLREENLDVMELRLLNTAFKELRYALKIFKPYRHTPKAAVFGSARTEIDHSSFKLAQEFGKKLAKKGWMLITGGASGIMEAAMTGAGTKNSFGLNILLPFEQAASEVIRGDEKLIHFKYFFTRKLMFLKESQATVLFPGGFGTFDEGFESLTLVQTGKAMPRPIVALDAPGSDFWKSTLRVFKKNMEGEKVISDTDLSLIRHFQNADEGVAEITGFYRNYESSRFLKDRYLVRLRRPLPDGVLSKMNRDFKDILSEGSFERLTDLAGEDNKDPGLGRIVFSFDRSGYSRLRQLIDYLNSV
ncbi:MAG: TIGR00730 family Rossman fold protein [Candidatus Omnitrophica bacterium]|nr:TIGR00730 family Rossman fold protein [Candidatus Omnitrophota bacterium]